MSWLALDIGGANLKAADGLGWARSMPFPLWSAPEGLATAIGGLVAAAPASTRWAVTMTGELCDCFRTKAEGVRHILAAVEEAAAGRKIAVYLVDGRMVAPHIANELPQLAAASNWHALARFASRLIGHGAGLLIDVGSTTTDVVPIVDGRIAAQGMCDIERLIAGELVYAGVGRTPISALVQALPYRGRMCPVSAEMFASTADAYVLLGEIEEQPEASWTADGRPLTKRFARERLARMICADATTFDADDASCAAEAVQQSQLTRLRKAVEQVASRMARPVESYVLSGVGEFLASRLVLALGARGQVSSLASALEPLTSACAPAHALAVLAREASEP